MLRILSPFEYFDPQTIEEAIRLLSTYGTKAKVLAGGTDLLVSMKKEKVSPRHIVYIKNIPGLDHIQYSRQHGLKIGTLVTHQSIADSPVIKENFGLLATACNKVGTPQIRNMGTIGGNICMAGPSQDTIPPLLVLEAKVKLVSARGTRAVPIDEFFVAPFKTILNEAELLTEIEVLPVPPRSAGCYQWLTKISTVDETLVGVAVLMALDTNKRICSHIRIGLTSVAPTPIRARQAEAVLLGQNIEEKVIEQAAEVAAQETRPRSRADYRRRMTRVLVKRAINEVWQKIKREN